MPQPVPYLARPEFEGGTSLYGGEPFWAKRIGMVEDRFGCDWIAPVDTRLAA
jgi:hypothetical protein